MLALHQIYGPTRWSRARNSQNPDVDYLDALRRINAHSVISDAGLAAWLDAEALCVHHDHLDPQRMVDALPAE